MNKFTICLLLSFLVSCGGGGGVNVGAITDVADPDMCFFKDEADAKMHDTIGCRFILYGNTRDGKSWPELK